MRSSSFFARSCCDKKSRLAHVRPTGGEFTAATGLQERRIGRRKKSPTDATGSGLIELQPLRTDP